MNELQLLERMSLIRAYEECLAGLQAQGPAPMSCSSQGQEASAAGVMAALRPQDRILTNHRSAGHLLARGADPGRLLAEVLGKAAGYCGGKSGSLHVSVRELGVVLTSTIVGGELSMAPGVALALKMRRQPGVVACFFGDGAACEGIFHEAMNLATVWRLPVLFVCENNQWQAFVRRREAMRTEHVSTWARGYGMATCTVDGNDVGAVLDAAAGAVAHVEATGEPYLLETWTYRQRGHYSGDDESHITPEERAPWVERDPILRLQQRLLARGTLDAAGAQDVDARARERIGQALAFARQAPYPDPQQLTTDVYA